mmetsp:Transcript_5445/g.11285  ORF Transcript_5445/g.11285 Transcript_5445/m.11285 type:complete len:203 (+) Transcript_5445:1-609(+)
MILCSPSPGTEASERITLIPPHPGVVWMRICTKYRSHRARLAMKRVPGVITLLSKWKVSSEGSASSPTLRPAARSSARSVFASASRSAFSLAALKRRVRCWFILARGAGPSIARNRTRRGRTTEKTRSMYAKIAANISSSEAGGGLPSGWAHGWMMPFMSRYSASNSIPFGLGCEQSATSPSAHCSSTTSTTTLGYASASHR